MFRDLKPYPEYAEPRSPWIPAFPSAWSVAPGAGVLQEVSAKNYGLRETTVLSLSYGRVIVKSDDKLHGLVPASFEGYQILEPGDIVIRPTDLQNDQTSLRVGAVQNRGIITSAYIGLRPRHIDNRFAFLYLKALDHMKVFYGMGSGLRQSLDFSDFKSLPVPIPTVEEQTAIVAYLAHAHERINKAIATKRQLAALREEEAQAVIAAILTGGQVHEARSDGLRPIPPSWRYEATGRICKITTGVEDSGNSDPGGAYPFFVRGREVLRSSDYLYDAEAVMTPGDGQGGTGKVFHYYNGKFQAHQRVYVMKDFDRVLGRYFFWFMSTFFREHALSKSNTVTMESLRRPVLASFPVALPSIGEQATITDRIESVRAQADRTIGALSKEIELLQEFRTRLTSDVVTGQFDVRAAAAALPKVDPAAVFRSASDDANEDDNEALECDEQGED